MEFEKRLREARMKRGLTQQTLAEAVDIALRTYQCYEQRTRRPSYEVLVALADELMVSVDYLLCRDQYIKEK